MEKRIKYTGIFIAILLLRLAISCSESSDSGETPSNAGGSGSNCPTKTCGDFSTRAAAQATYNSNKSCYKNLDSDSDGIACENLK